MSKFSGEWVVASLIIQGKTNPCLGPLAVTFSLSASLSSYNVARRHAPDTVQIWLPNHGLLVYQTGRYNLLIVKIQLQVLHYSNWKQIDTHSLGRQMNFIRHWCKDDLSMSPSLSITVVGFCFLLLFFFFEKLFLITFFSCEWLRTLSIEHLSLLAFPNYSLHDNPWTFHESLGIKLVYVGKKVKSGFGNKNFWIIMLH